MDELTRDRRVERISDGLRMECWGLADDGAGYRCSWYEGREQRWGNYPKNEIRTVVKATVVTGKETDWRQLKW